jgi:hypothetical protein
MGKKQTDLEKKQRAEIKTLKAQVAHLENCIREVRTTIRMADVPMDQAEEDDALLTRALELTPNSTCLTFSTGPK